jgi:hypothetical protein
MYNTLEQKLSGDVTAVRPMETTNQISIEYMQINCNVLLQVSTHHNGTLPRSTNQ